MSPTFDPNGWTVGYSRDGIASIGQLHMAEVHAAAPVCAWITWVPEPMSMDAALALIADVNASQRAARVAAATCAACGRVLAA